MFPLLRLELCLLNNEIVWDATKTQLKFKKANITIKLTYHFLAQGYFIEIIKKFSELFWLS